MGKLDQITRPAQAAGYRPNVYSGTWLSAVLDGRPRFTWLEAERMRFHPQVQFGLRILRSPLWGATWTVKADRDDVARWVDRELKHVYQRLLPRLVRFYEFGVAAGEVTFTARTSKSTGRTRVHFADFFEFHPRDVTPVVFERGLRSGQFAGLKVRGLTAGGGVYLDRRHGFWFKGESEFGQWYGRPRLANAYEPWFEKCARHGAIDSRRLFYTKDAFRGPLMRHPLGFTDMGTPEQPFLMSNEDIARQIVEKFVNGGVLTLPNTKDDKGDYLWSWEDPKAFSDIAGLLDYPKQLDREILIGLGIPPELVDAATVGSGYSGRAIPAQVFFSSMDEIIALLIEAIDRQIIRPLVRLNFGRVGYVVEPNSLAKALNEAMPGAMGTPGAAPGGQGAAQPGPSGQVPYVGPRGGHGTRDPRTGHIHYGQDKNRAHVRLSVRGAKAKKRARKTAQARRAAGGRVRMGWRPYQGPKGGHGWVSDSGEVRYQTNTPADHESQPDVGPEALFDHPDYAHLSDPGTAKPGALASYAAGAQEKGLDPADVHRRAAGHLDEMLHRRAAAAQPGAPKWSRSAVLDQAYSLASADARAVQEEARDKDTAGAFAGTYFDHEHPVRRAAKYLKGLAGGLDAAHLDADTRDAITEDLSHLPPAKLAQHVAYTGHNHGQDDPVWKIAHTAADLHAQRAAAHGKVARGERFDPAKPENYYVVTPGSAPNEDYWAAAQKAAQVAGSAGAKFVDPSKALIVRHGSALDKAISENGVTGQNELNDSDGRHELFDALTSEHQLPQDAVPASAKDYGGTSGSKGSGEYAPEADWNPHHHDVYRRLDEHHFVKRIGDANPDESGFDLVHRKDAPPLSRLPNPYWEGFDSTPDPNGSDVSARYEARAEKASEDGAKEKRADERGPGARELTRQSHKLIGEHTRTGNLVRSDESLHEKLQELGSDYDFSGFTPPEPEARDDGSMPDRLDGLGTESASDAVQELHDTLGALADHEHGHEYDPDEIAPFDSSLLSHEHSSRNDRATDREDVERDFANWQDETGEAVRRARKAAVDTAQKFRRGAAKKLRAVLAAARTVAELPGDAVGDEGIQEHAREIVARAEGLLARANKSVRMSLRGSRGRSGRRSSLRAAWDRSPGPVLTALAL